jgi:outer membrane protein OmpA-like peptidoglycan-associated protein
MSTGSPTRQATVQTTTTTTTTEGYYWERRRRGALPWVVGAVGLAALGVAQFVPLRHNMETDLTSRSQAVLQAAGLSGVQVEFTGRDAKLTGTAQSPADVERALAAVRGLEGVRVATAQIAVPGGASGNQTGNQTATPSSSPSASESTAPTSTGSPSPEATPSTSAAPSEAATGGSPSASASPSASTGASAGAGTGDLAGVQQQLAALPQVTFDNASATLTPAGRAVVDRAAAILKANPTLKVRLDGYTDDNGDWDVNKGLSVARAQTVRQTLIADGVQGARLTTFGWSEEKPKAPNSSEANRALNRRVEFVVLG